MPAKPISILVVDDIRLMRLLFKKYVQTAGPEIFAPAYGEVEIEIIEAEDGIVAARLLEERTFDLMILDLMMPGKDGITLLEEIQQEQRLRDLKIVVCSAVGDQAVIDKAMGLGAAAYIVKPFTLHSVRDRLAEVLGGQATKA